MTEIEGLIEKVAGIITEIRGHYPCPNYDDCIIDNCADCKARQILQTEYEGLRVGVYRKDGELPFTGTINKHCQEYTSHYCYLCEKVKSKRIAQQDMLSAGYKQFVEVKE